MSTQPGEGAPQTTGRSVVVFSDDVRGDRDAIAAALRSLAGVTDVAGAADYVADGADLDVAQDGRAITFDTLGIAVVALDPATLTASVASAPGDGAIVAVEPERVMHAISVDVPGDAAQFADDDRFTWGLHATKTDSSSATGRGVRVAVLDTGLDLDHPDFAGRSITSQSFVAGVPSANDGHGHGTHCIGTSCGPAVPPQGRRYGIASEAEIFAGKVLSDQGSGADAAILAGIEWAITNGCHIISMSLGADVEQVSPAYEAVGRRALDAGALIVAAAGNNAARQFGDPGFVGVPANSASIMAVAAVDANLQIADFSAAANPVEGGEIDLAGPGVAVFSAWPMPQRNNTISGTSMATPHVAGIAALLSQATGATAQALWDALVQGARKLDLPATDAGAGLAQAPA
jgi:subtilisin family serine protease